ncbi:MAG: nuclear transport factor 2 family protein, partial [Pseudomonadota bacterium]
MGSPQQFVESYLNAWNAQDATGVAGHLGTDGKYVDGASQEHLTGEALVEHLVDYFSSDEYRYEIVGDVLSNEKTVAFQYRVVPRDPSSKAAGWGGAEFIELDGEVAQQISDYYRLPTATPNGSGPKGRRYAKSGLGEDAMATLLASLKSAMENEKTFLDPDLSLPRLASNLACDRWLTEQPR